MTLGVLAAGAALLMFVSFAVFLLFDEGLGAIWDLGWHFWRVVLVLGAIIYVLAGSRQSKWFAKHLAVFYTLDATATGFVLTYWAFSSGASSIQMVLTSCLPFVWDALVYSWHRSRIRKRDS